MKQFILLFVVVLYAFAGCTSSESKSQPQLTANDSIPIASTKLSTNTIYFYRSSFPEFTERVNWIATTDPNGLAKASNDARKEHLRWKDMVFSVGDPLAMTWHYFGMGRNDSGQRKILFWASPISDPTDAPIANHFERTLRSLPKLKDDGLWELREIESIDFEPNDPAKKIFLEMADYNSAGMNKTKQAQSQARALTSATALVFRESDNSILFINGIKWNHPLYSDGYTEFQLHISQKTGAVINDSYAYTNFPLEPGQFTQYAAIAKSTADAIVYATKLMAK